MADFTHKKTELRNRTELSKQNIYQLFFRKFVILIPTLFFFQYEYKLQWCRWLGKKQSCDFMQASCNARIQGLNQKRLGKGHFLIIIFPAS